MEHVSGSPKGAQSRYGDADRRSAFFSLDGGGSFPSIYLVLRQIKKNNLVIAKGGAKIFMIFQILDFCHFLQKQKLGHQSNRRGHKIFGKIQKSEKS